MTDKELDESIDRVKHRYVDEGYIDVKNKDILNVLQAARELQALRKRRRVDLDAKRIEPQFERKSDIKTIMFVQGYNRCLDSMKKFDVFEKDMVSTAQFPLCTSQAFLDSITSPAREDEK